MYNIRAFIRWLYKYMFRLKIVNFSNKYNKE